jgi:DNA-binding HxlR family transcriptional regulator
VQALKPFAAAGEVNMPPRNFERGMHSPDDAPLIELFDVLGRRWALRVIWELGTDALTYRELGARIPDMSTSVLTDRLRQLREANLIEHHRGTGYRLTRLGAELLAHLERLGAWALHVDFRSGAGSERQ